MIILKNLIGHFWEILRSHLIIFKTNKWIFLKLINERKTLNIYSTFPMYSIPKGNQIED